MSTKDLEIFWINNYQGIVRISADSPLLDHKILADMISLFLNNNFDIVTNVFPKKLFLADNQLK